MLDSRQTFSMDFSQWALRGIRITLALFYVSFSSCRFWCFPPKKPKSHWPSLRRHIGCNFWELWIVLSLCRIRVICRQRIAMARRGPLDGAGRTTRQEETSIRLIQNAARHNYTHLKHLSVATVGCPNARLIQELFCRALYAVFG